jgi:hypothetical protein
MSLCFGMVICVLPIQVNSVYKLHACSKVCILDMLLAPFASSILINCSSQTLPCNEMAVLKSSIFHMEHHCLHWSIN